MKIIFLLALFGIFGLANASSDPLVKKIGATRYGQNLKELEALNGPALESSEKRTRWKNAAYTFVWNKKKRLFYLEPKSLHLTSMPIKRYEFERKNKGDENLGGLLSAPAAGVYLEADPDGRVQIIYWKSPWKEKEKKMVSREEAIKLLRAPGTIK